MLMNHQSSSMDIIIDNDYDDIYYQVIRDIGLQDWTSIFRGLIRHLAVPNFRGVKTNFSGVARTEYSRPLLLCKQCLLPVSCKLIGSP